MSAFGKDHVDGRDNIGARQQIGMRAARFEAHTEDSCAETHEAERHHEGALGASCIEYLACHDLHPLTASGRS